MLYEIHMLKNYPATNLNRDDSGAPKCCVFGGINRGRISSQCLKRSWRTAPYFQEAVGKEYIGTRTRKLPDLVEAELLRRGIPADAVKPWFPAITGIANKDGKENKDGNYTAQVIFFAAEDVCAVADAIQELLEAGKKKGKAKDILEKIKNPTARSVSLDMALFGRMVTSDAFRNVEASMQVAHAISTNKVNMESDYFTAMDDLLKGEDMESSGSGMIGDIDYNSSCYYIYASLDSDSLLENLSASENPEEIIHKAIPALLRTMAYTNPSGKQNSFAGHVLPSAVLVECKNAKIPVSYINAYAEPARVHGGRGLVADSVEKLVEECNTVSREYGIPVEKRVWFCTRKYAASAPEQAVVCENFDQLVSEVEATLK